MPKSLAPLAYANLSCDQIRAEILRVNHRFGEVYEAQKDTAEKDAGVVLAGIFFFPALVFLATGDDSTDEIGRRMGEAEALQEAAIDNNCSFKDTIIAVREERARREEARNKQQSGGFLILPAW